jgi:hypothetical protein
LPHGGIGNDLTADMWAPVLHAVPALAQDLLDVLGAEGVPAYAAPTMRSTGNSTGTAWRLWIATRRYASAQDILRRALPGLLDKYPNGVL